MPLIKRSFFIPCSGEECIKLAELIKDNISVLEASIDIKEHGIEVTMYGYKTDIKKMWVKIRQVISTYRELMKAGESGYKKIPLEYLVSLTRKTFPPLLLVEILKKKRFTASYENGVIETNADLDTLKELIDRIASIFEEIKYDVRSTTTKYFIVSASILTGLEPRIVIEKGIEKGLLKLEEEKPKLTKEWRQALSEFISQHTSNYDESGTGNTSM